MAAPRRGYADQWSGGAMAWRPGSERVGHGDEQRVRSDRPSSIENCSAPAESCSAGPFHRMPLLRATILRHPRREVAREDGATATGRRAAKPPAACLQRVQEALLRHAE